MSKWFKFSVYKNKEDQKFIIHWLWSIPYIPFESVEYAKTSKQHQLVFCGTDNLYWIFSKSWDDKKYKFLYKTINDHVSCG